MDIKNVQKWCREFNEGRINVHDEQRSGRPSLPESTVVRIDEMVRANRRITLEEIENGVNEDCSHFSVHKIVSETLGYRKVSARWVDRWLKEAAGEWYNTGITKLVDRMKKPLRGSSQDTEDPPLLVVPKAEDMEEDILLVENWVSPGMDEKIFTVEVAHNSQNHRQLLPPGNKASRKRRVHIRLKFSKSVMVWA
ncbi:hypothetical protein LAZ67_5003235 [Cordylochernes scorpioides]|uniref:Transposase n=1 Tax=Cordylochernes scorpioides TaxID=51811 RepID=A0ABY6KIB0_9ARAC|nr:hypothetical protein LAZ67_5003235 [Cordylochernes scorpioides]